MIVEDPVPAFELDDSEPTSTHDRGVCQDCEMKCFDIEKVVKEYSVGGKSTPCATAVAYFASSRC